MIDKYRALIAQVLDSQALPSKDEMIQEIILTTDEIIKAYHERAKKADWALSSIIMRATCYEKTTEYNERLKFLLKDCRDALSFPDKYKDKEALLERISKMLEDDE